MVRNDMTQGVDRVAGRFGVPAQALAVIMILAGILIIAFPKLLQWILGLFLILMGVLWLIDSFQRRDGLPGRSAPPAHQPPASPPRI